MYCVKCGAELAPGTRFCTSCGAPVQSAARPAGDDAGQTGTVVSESPGTPPEQPRVAVPSPAPDQYQPPRKSHGALVAVLVGVATFAVAFAIGWLGTRGGFDALRGMLGGGTSQTSDDSNTTVPAENVSVPDVVGLSREAATSTLTGAGLTVGSVSERYSDTVDEGHVISQGTSAGTSVAGGSSVDLVVSRGQEPTTHAYTLVRQAMTWEQARAYCTSHGGYLATIADADEYQRVLSAVDGTGVRVCWVGGYRDGSTWRWVTGEEFSYQPWAAGEPNDEGGNEDCLALLENDSDAWGWYDCPNDLGSTYRSKYLGFVMETES